MNLTYIWSIAASVYGLCAAGSLGLAWSFYRRAPKGPETRLLTAALLTLFLHYVVNTAGAFEQLTARGLQRFTLPEAIAPMFGLVLLIWICHFLGLILKRLVTGMNCTWFIWTGRIYDLVILGIVSTFIWTLSAGDGEAVIRPFLHRINGNVLIWWLYPTTLLGEILRRLPVSSSRGWRGLISRQPVPMVSLNIEPQRDARAIVWPRLAQADTRGLAAVYVIVVALSILSFDLSEWSPGTLIGTVVLRALILLGMAGLIHFHTRFTFYDVALKRGASFLVLALIAGAIAYTVVPPGALRPVVCLSLTLLAAGWTWLYRRLDRALDRTILRRPDYRVVLNELSEAMNHCTDEKVLITLVTERLSADLHAKVELISEPQQAGAVLIWIRKRDYLVLGERERGQNYGSEDLSFVEAVAGRLTGLLEAFSASRAEVKALRAQINPHFLFNTLNTLADMAKGRPELERTILHLARVFRYALDSTLRERVPLREEVEFVRSYLEIEQARFEDKLRFEIDVPEGLLEDEVPPMLIQPLVENAVKHGISRKVEGGSIRISARRTARGIQVNVNDDGVGFDPATAKQSVGMENVRSRVAASGGEWSIRSGQATGTDISMELVTR